MAVGAKALKIIQAGNVSALHLRHLHPRMMDFDAGFCVGRPVLLNRRFTAALTDEAPAVKLPNLELLRFPGMRLSLADQVLAEA